MPNTIRFDTSVVRGNLSKLAARFPSRVAQALAFEMEVEATEAKRRTPVDKGNLRASVHVDGPEIEGRVVKAALVAGGPAAPYAIHVHENLDAFHPVGQAKFIESVLLESAPFMAERIAKRIDWSE